ncbi:MAG: hypothetical protein UV74_C0013G0402 [Candidatus Woesebacteria bacterium GW2011_GWB1_43_14]|uniref:Yip1 domain-containing protein n=1 Tax=Candidatus Woesebacteria bacterium GW2011_GWB1_43_14 TaxID=1618578 RepID=A0A0G1DHD6_9BACT|nr:MAG: hypothetical protein UT21_C0001G0114 [Candidatus Woesebacteria bacterium GW2011_GWA1_39_11b]KKS78302.1 MAG: hypothetical protein UV51_C0001G0018 [Candidatus Woesebacteria bacterium GW2011_GWC1_42_9]KKS97280.1 MAG: hypothetical protein UV74_C0013G0402 [Candidatus Woesebacteria bacterium GW2011_GWB1_43_14]
MYLTVDISGSIQKAKRILFSPRSFGKDISQEKGIKEAFGYFVLLRLVATILLLFNIFVIVPLGWGESYYNASPREMITFVVLSFFIALISVFISAGILHLWIRLFRGKGDYTKTFQVYVYSKTPSFLLSWIPILGFISVFFGWYLMYLGIVSAHNLSKRKAIVLILIPFIFFVTLSLVLSVYFLNLTRWINR